jgi:hypothetical protein
MSRLVPVALIGAVLAAAIAANPPGRDPDPPPSATTSTAPATTAPATTAPAATVTSRTPPAASGTTTPDAGPAPAAPAATSPAPTTSDQATPSAAVGVVAGRTDRYGFPVEVAHPDCAVTSWYRDSTPSWWIDCSAATPSDLTAYAGRFTDTERAPGTTGAGLTVIRRPWQITATFDRLGLHVVISPADPVAPSADAIEGPLADLPTGIPRPAVPISMSEAASGPDGRRRWTLSHRDARPEDHTAYATTLIGDGEPTDRSLSPNIRYVSAVRDGYDIEALWTPDDGLVVTVHRP